jgi:transcriptional regulator with XRE-family HTH domain
MVNETGGYLTFAEQLRILFEMRQHPQRRTYTLQDVSQETGIALATLSQMRTGKIRNPQLNTVREIARFFAVPLRYFETTSAEECYAILAGGAEAPAPALNEIAFRATHLSPQAQQDILRIIKWVQVAEQNLGEGEQLPPLPGLGQGMD